MIRIRRSPATPTIVPVVAAPVLAATKTDTLLIDTLPAGASSGDTLLYQVTINNSGNTAATSVIFNDAPDSNTTLVNGSVQTNLGTVTKGNTAGDTSLSVDIGTLPVGASVSISFRVTINTPVPAGVTQVANQGIVSASNSPTVLTDDPDTAAPGDPTVTPLAFAPIIDATKTAQLFADVDGDGVTSPGDILLYTVTICNSGNTAATNVVFTDMPDSNTTLVVGSAQASQGTVTQGQHRRRHRSGREYRPHPARRERDDQLPRDDQRPAAGWRDPGGQPGHHQRQQLPNGSNRRPNHARARRPDRDADHARAADHRQQDRQAVRRPG